MNIPLVSSRRRPCRAATTGAFTLIELLTVMAIILVLAGLVLAIAGNANNKSARARAEAEIKGIETALENYKADNGTYPRNAETDKLDANVDSAAPPDPSTYKLAGAYLFQQLTGNAWVEGGTGNPTTPTKGYITFIPSQLSTGSAAFAKSTVTTGAGPTFVIDPFGLAYGYSTRNASAVESAQASASATTDVSKEGYNPTFDLWSTGGYAASGGKTYPNDTKMNTAQLKTGLWIKNW